MSGRKVPCEVYSIVCGYFQPVRNWNKGKQEEFKERKMHLNIKEDRKRHTQICQCCFLINCIEDSKGNIYCPECMDKKNV